MHTVLDETNPEQLTLVDILRWRAQHEPQREAYTFLLDGETKKVQMTYAELDLQARRIAALLQNHVALGERALLLYPPGLEYVAAVFGCFYAGVVAVPAYPPRMDQSLVKTATADVIKTLNLSHWAIAFISAEPVRAETRTRFAATFASCGFRPGALYPCYGMTEVTLLVSGTRRLIKPRVRTFEREALEAGRVVETTGQRVADRPLVTCGSVQQGQEIVIVDPQTLTPCPPDTIGEIWVRGPNIAAGYWGKTEETSTSLRCEMDGAA